MARSLPGTLYFCLADSIPGKSIMAVHSLKKGKTVRQQLSREEWEKRVGLAAAYRLVDLYGMTEMSANHISTRVPGEEGAFFIWPAPLRKLDKIDASYRE
jgi:hypothetical protein